MSQEKSERDEIEITAEMLEAAALRLWELVGDDGISRRRPLDEFQWLIGQCLLAAGLQMEEHVSDY